MNSPADLDIAGILCEAGAIRFRYARVMSADKTRWVRHGLFVAYDENGTAVSEGHCVDGKEHGPWRDFHPDGTLAAEGRYHEGSGVGLWRFWNPDGTEGPGTNCDA